MKEIKRELILNNFKKMILDEGYSKLSINHLTKKCNISKGSFYTYFSSKDEILSIVIDEYIEFLLELNNKWKIELKNIDEFLEKYFTYRAELNNKELELELVVINLFKNLEIIDDKNLKKIYYIHQIWKNMIEETLKKYLKISAKDLFIYTNIIDGVIDKFQLMEIIELREERPRFKKIEELKKILNSKEYRENSKIIIENVKKIILDKIVED